MKSKLVKGIIAGIIVIGVGFGGFYGYKTYFGKKTVTAAAQYLTVTSQKMDLSVTVQGTGSAYAGTTKDVSANNNGTLESLSLKVGDKVTKGQKLFVSDSDELRNNVTTAKNNLAMQKLTLASDESAENADDNKIASDELNVSNAQTQLTAANTALSNMTVKSPIAGVVTAVNNSNGDSVQSGNPVLTIVDMNSMKVKVSVDELEINNVKVGQEAQIKFDAIEDKTYEGTVESVAQTGTTSNNVTTYDVVVDITNPTGIKLGMNATVTISVESKKDALAIPIEALVESNDKKYVRVLNSSDSTATTSQSSNAANSSTANSNAANSSTASGTGKQASNSAYKLVEIKTGVETEDYIEVTEGLTENEKLAVQLPQSTTTTNSNEKGGMGEMRDMGGMSGGAPQGGAPSQGSGGSAPQGSSSGK